jgi:hypothetical protein
MSAGQAGKQDQLTGKPGVQPRRLTFKGFRVNRVFSLSNRRTDQAAVPVLIRPP